MDETETEDLVGSYPCGEFTMKPLLLNLQGPSLCSTLCIINIHNFIFFFLERTPQITYAGPAKLLSTLRT